MAWSGVVCQSSTVSWCAAMQSSVMRGEVWAVCFFAVVCYVSVFYRAMPYCFVFNDMKSLKCCELFYDTVLRSGLRCRTVFCCCEVI